MKERVWMVVLLALVALVSAGMLAVINIKTAPIVRKNNEIKLKKSVLDVYGIEYLDEEIEAVFDKNVAVVGKGDGEYYRMKDGGGQGGESPVAFKISGPGFWGPIHVLIAMQSDFETIAGVKFLKHEETPGLGGRVDEEWFYSQFSGKRIKPALVKVPFGTAENQNEFDAITGATETSRSVEALINRGVDSFVGRVQL